MRLLFLKCRGNMTKVLVGLLPLSLLLVAVRSSCNIDQRNHCLDLYRKTASFWNGGSVELSECSPRPYSEFTHVCSVSNYLPSIDHCCCSVKDVSHDVDDAADDGDVIVAGDVDDRESKNAVGRVEERSPRFKRLASETGEGGQKGRRTKRDTDVTVMCCRYHQDWNRFRCQQPLDTLDTRYTHGSVFRSNFESLTSSLLSYGFFVVVVMTLVAVVVCFVRRRRNSRKVKARKNNNLAASRANGTGLTPPTFDEVPPPYSPAAGYYGSPYEGQSSIHHPLIPAERSRAEPSAPAEEETLLQSPTVEYYFGNGGNNKRRQNQLDSILTTDTVLTLDASLLSSEEDSTSRLDSDLDPRTSSLSRDVEAVFTSLETGEPERLHSRGKLLDSRPLVAPVHSTETGRSRVPDLLAGSRSSPPPTYEESVGGGV